MKNLNPNAKAAKTVPHRQWAEFSFPLILAVVLAVLFCKSFLPDYVHFSNDGPLGQQNAAWSRFPGALTGEWGDQNDIGNRGGAASPDITSFATWILGPVGYSKFYPPIVEFILGIGAWVFFRQLKLSPLAAALGAIAFALNSSFFGNACWGTCSQEVAMGMVLLALALVMANSDETRPLNYWTRMALAGMAVGINVMEGADNGAIFSLFVAAFVFFNTMIEAGAPIFKRVARGVGRVAVIALFAMFIAAQTVATLVGTFIVGISGIGTGPNTETPLEHWDWATQWSVPKKETLGIFVPGLFGYRMDTPKDMMNSFTNLYQGGEYWGGVGRTPAIDRYFDSGSQGSMPQGMMRFGYGGYYCGILVALIALFAMVRSMQKENCIFSKTQRYFVWFWTAVLIIALLLAWGRFGPFNGWPYRWLYALPGASTIRNPGKFMAIFYLALVIIFAYGTDALSRLYLSVSEGKPSSPIAQFKNWLTTVRGFDRKWSLFCVIGFAAAILAWLMYASQTGPLADYLQKVGFDQDSAKQIAAFSIGQAGFFLLFLAGAIVLMILVLSGVFSGRAAKLGGFLLGALLVVDMGRADLPWIIHWNYKQKYASNAIIDLLRDKPYEHRVSDIPSNSLFEQLYRIEWMQHHFPYYNIQCLDKIQQPRMPADLEAYEMAFIPTGPENAYLMTRRWQLSNTRYLLGPAAYVDQINDQLDPGKRRFRILQRFNVVPKPGVEQVTELEQLTVTPDNNGDYALFDFTGALPRASLYSNWEVNTNDNATLQHLAAAAFDPLKTVLVSTVIPNEPMTSPANGNAGTVEYKSYTPKDIVLDAEAKMPSVLLLNDEFDPSWRVYVDGKPANLLRCNFIMRGVFLNPGSHTVEFEFSLPAKPLYITLVAIGAGIVLCVILIMSSRKPPFSQDNNSSNPAIKKTKKDETPQAAANRPRNQDARQATR